MKISSAILLIFLSGLFINQDVFSQTMTSTQFDGELRKISFDKNGAPLDYHSVAGNRWQHLQDMIRLPDANGKEYYMGAFSQNVTGGTPTVPTVLNTPDLLEEVIDKLMGETEGGMVFVGEVSKGQKTGKIIWVDVLHNGHDAGGFNHPGDLRRIGNMVVIAGQNWDGTTDSMIKTLGSQIGRSMPGADDMRLGNGGNGVLFYDVTNPASPTYAGKINSCKNGSKIESVTTDISSLSAVRMGQSYYMTFGSPGDDGKIISCKCDEFTADGDWEYVSNLDLKGGSYLKYELNGERMQGGAKLTTEYERDMVAFTRLDGNMNQSTTILTPIPETSFGGSTTFNLSVLNNNRAAAVYADVESNAKIEIEVIESSKSTKPITNLFLRYEEEGEIWSNYTKIPVDLNRDADGDLIYLYYTTDPALGSPITDIKVEVDTGWDYIPAGYEPFSCSRKDKNGLCDVNRKASGSDIFMFQSRDPSKGNPISMVDILTSKNYTFKNWKKIDKDLNKGAEGADLFLTYYAADKPEMRKSKNNHILYAGFTLDTEERLYSPNEEYWLEMQDDGNLCIYNKNKKTEWCNYKQGIKNARLNMQSDGNLVVYSDKFLPLWASNTNSSSSEKANRLVLENDGSLKLYNRANEVVWSVNE